MTETENFSTEVINLININKYIDFFFPDHTFQDTKYERFKLSKSRKKREVCNLETEVINPFGLVHFCLVG